MPIRKVMRLDQGDGGSTKTNKAMVLELQAEWNLLYEELVGLGNLDEPDRFPVPDDVEELGEVCSYLPEWGEEAASVDVVYWTSGGAAPFLVTSEGLVVGRYSSLEELRDHIDPGEFFEATDELREPESDD